MLHGIVESNYLADPGIDPLFDSLKADPEFQKIRVEAMRRQKEFLARRGPATP
jgi:hypothetical protein